MNFKELILKNVNELTVSEMFEIKIAIDSLLGITDSIQATATAIKKERGLLQSVKYVKDITRWSLLESKNFCDKL